MGRKHSFFHTSSLFFQISDMLSARCHVTLNGFSWEDNLDNIRCFSQGRIARIANIRLIARMVAFAVISFNLMTFTLFVPACELENMWEFTRVNF